jgi:hypothetical protein
MIAAGAGGAGTNRKPLGEFCLAGGGECGAFFVTDADPFDLAATHRIGQRIEGIADQSKDVFDTDLFEHANQLPFDRLCHCPLPMAPRPIAASKPLPPQMRIDICRAWKSNGAER